MTRHADKIIARAVREEARQAEQAHAAPDFDAMWQRAQALHAATPANDDAERPSRLRAPLAMACAAALCIAAWFGSDATRHIEQAPEAPAVAARQVVAPPEVIAAQAPSVSAPLEAPLEAIDEAQSWDAPTDFSLAEGSLWDADEEWDTMWEEPLDEQL